MHAELLIHFLKVLGITWLSPNEVWRRHHSYHSWGVVRPVLCDLLLADIPRGKWPPQCHIFLWNANLFREQWRSLDSHFVLAMWNLFFICGLGSPFSWQPSRDDFCLSTTTCRFRVPCVYHVCPGISCNDDPCRLPIRYLCFEQIWKAQITLFLAHEY